MILSYKSVKFSKNKKPDQSGYPRRTFPPAQMLIHLGIFLLCYALRTMLQSLSKILIGYFQHLPHGNINLVTVNIDKIAVF